MNAGYGLAVRWSLSDAPDDVAEQLREYVVSDAVTTYEIAQRMGLLAA